MTDKFMQEFNEYNKLMKRLRSKQMTLETYKLYRAGKLRRSRGKSAVKSPLETTSYIRPSPIIVSGDGIGTFVGKKEENKYTGNKLIGIATMHKSNMVPVFSKEAAQEISSMRR
jgi:hypothetical protein